MKKLKPSFIVFTLLIFLTLDISLALGESLEEYIEYGINNNLTLNRKEISCRQSINALKVARGKFLPAVTIEARYSRAGGGRIIDFPVGDLMNPVYSTLNEYLAAIGAEPQFPMNIPNERIPFLREEEHETKLRLTQPIFHPSILYNYRIRGNMAQIAQYDQIIFRKELKRDITIALYNYIKTVHVVNLYEETVDLLKENLRVSEKLYEIGKVTQANVFRAEAELSEVEQNRADAIKNRKLARSYFNFLLNRPHSTPVNVKSEDLASEYFYHSSLDSVQSEALARREELNKIGAAIDIARNQLNMVRGKFLPNVSVVFDYGYQGEKYRFTAEDDYWMGSVVLQWNLFNGFQDIAEHQEKQLEIRKNRIQQQEIQNQIKLQVQQALDETIVAVKKIETATQRLQSARKSFKIISKKYEQGMASQIEYIDSRTSLTNAEINLILEKFDYQIKRAELDWVAGK